MPCFNLGRYLAEALHSVRDQTLSDVELVVVDDGSTEAETIREPDGVAAAGTQVIRSENRGLSAARNLGIRHTRGEYICCLDADDALVPSWLDRAVAQLDGDRGVGFVSHWLETFGDEQGEWTPGRIDLGALLDKNTVNGAALFRREIIDAVGGFDESMRDGCEDWEFWIRVIEAGYRGTIVPEVLYRYRRRPDSMSRAMNATDTWFRLYGELIDKHPGSYREHLLDLMLRRDWTIAGLCRGIDGVQDELAVVLEPALAERRLELERAEARLEAVTAHGDVGAARLRDLESARDDAVAQVTALHRSWSWRITRPLRRVYEWFGLGETSGPDGLA